MRVPELPDDVFAADLDRSMRSRLRGLSKDNADRVARHLVVALEVMDHDSELGYAHARAAADRAGRIDVVREVAGLAAYRTGRYAEALRELRTARRLTGSWSLAALEADCERGLGRPERAIEVAKAALDQPLEPDERAETVIVLAGARADLGERDAGIALISRTLTERWPSTERARLEAARHLLADEDVPGDLLDVADPIDSFEPAVEVIDSEDPDLAAADAAADAAIAASAESAPAESDAPDSVVAAATAEGVPTAASAEGSEPSQEQPGPKDAR